MLVVLHMPYISWIRLIQFDKQNGIYYMVTKVALDGIAWAFLSIINVKSSRERTGSSLHVTIYLSFTSCVDIITAQLFDGIN